MLLDAESVAWHRDGLVVYGIRVLALAVCCQRLASCLIGLAWNELLLHLMTATQDMQWITLC